MNNKKRPIVAMPGWKTGDNSFGCGVNHLDFISRFGNPKILFPQDTHEEIDLLYLPGGPDLDPSTYGSIPGFYTGNPDLFKQYFFDNNLRGYIESGTKVVGVCLGMQMLNVYFDGKITQDLKYHAQSDGRWQKGHDVFLWGEEKNKKNSFEVNSHHHQAVTLNDLSDQFIPLAYSINEEDNRNPIIEAFKHRELPIIGFQWHPKFFGAC